MSLTGGCQCGAVRFRVEGELGRASLCSCRMCQKAFAAPYAALVTVRAEQLVWTRGARSRFQSSNKVSRGFCNACGTPLTFEWDAAKIDLAICAFDTPDAVAPQVQLRAAAQPAWAAGVANLPAGDSAASAAHDAGVVSFQHPDHDTAQWP
ncbi:GFA family protein [Phenylobacterium sp. LjRoot219]|uniref:GFA family protein n=1 Tax=Phenylobacterium sp. LjRoot219 TaxID=3342283 RepID=UPI003ED0536D